MNSAAPLRTPTHLVPMDVCDEEHPVLRRPWLGGAGRDDRGLGDLGQGDVPGRVQVKAAAGGAHQQGAGLRGP